MDRTININNLILLIESEYFIAILIIQDGLAVVDVPEAAEDPVQPQHILTFIKPI